MEENANDFVIYVAVEYSFPNVCGENTYLS
jgi:hypothetical protein